MSNREPEVRFDELVAALRETAGSTCGEGDATRRRVFATLERRAGGHRRRVGVATLAFMIGAATASWAAMGERFEPWFARWGWRRPPQAVALPPDLTPIVETSAPIPPQATLAGLERTEAWQLSPPAAESEPKRVEPPRSPRPGRVDDELAYRRAHALHFHGGDAAEALVAWDRYLSARPAGRFSIEARWNRAVVLVRLARYAEALAALEPFASGEVAPSGYRRADATRLREVLRRRVARAAP